MLKIILNDGDAPIFDVISKASLLELLSKSEQIENWYGQLMVYPQTIAYFLQLNIWMRDYKVRIST